MCVLYKHFSKDYQQIADYSEQAMISMYVNETYGQGEVKLCNGYSIGKKIMDITIAMWKEDIQSGLLFKQELYDDPDFPNEWLKKIGI